LPVVRQPGDALEFAVDRLGQRKGIQVRPELLQGRDLGRVASL
jgi:hypothetical protein